MARFVESAVIRVVDGSSGPLAKIDRALANLQRRAAAMASMPAIRVDTARTLAGVRAIGAETARVQRVQEQGRRWAHAVAMRDLRERERAIVRAARLEERAGRNGFSIASQPGRLPASRVRQMQAAVERLYVRPVAPPPPSAVRIASAPPIRPTSVPSIAAQRAGAAEQRLASARAKSAAAAERAATQEAEVARKRVTFEQTRTRAAERSLQSAERELSRLTAAAARTSASVARSESLMLRARAASERQAERDARRSGDSRYLPSHYAKNAVGYSVAYGGIDRLSALADRSREAARDGSSQRTMAKLRGMSAAESNLLEEQARRASQAFQENTTASLFETGREAVANLKNPQEAERVMRAYAKLQTVSGVIYQDQKRAEEFSRLAAKMADTAGASETAADQERFTEALMRGMIGTEGKSINPSALRYAFRDIPTAMRRKMSADAIAEFVMMNDEQARAAATNRRVAYQDMTRTNLSDEKKRAQAAFGLRNADGTSNAALADKFATDFNRAVWDLVIPKMVKAGVDIDDETAVEKFVNEKLGLNPTGARAFMDAITKREEYQRFRRTAGKVDYSDKGVKDLTRKDLRASGQRIEAQFANAVDSFTKPVQEAFAEVKSGIANMLARAAEPSTPATSKVAAGTIGLAVVGAMKAWENPGATAHLGAAAALTTSATALSAAAAKLSVAGPLTGAAGAAGAAGVGGAALSKWGFRVLKVGGAAGSAALLYDFYTFLNEHLDTPERRLERMRTSLENHGGTEGAKEEMRKRIEALAAAIKNEKLANQREAIERNNRATGMNDGGVLGQAERRLGIPQSDSRPRRNVENAIVAAHDKGRKLGPLEYGPPVPEDIAAQINTASHDGGSTIASQILGAIRSGASDLSAAIANAVANISVSVNGPAERGNTGVNQGAVR